MCLTPCAPGARGGEGGGKEEPSQEHHSWSAANTTQSAASKRAEKRCKQAPGNDMTAKRIRIQREETWFVELPHLT